MRLPFDEGTTLADRMRRHAGDRTHLYGFLMRAMADDWERGGPVREICAGYEDAPAGAVVQLRLLAGLFRVVLTGRAPGLEPYYPCLGGTAPPEGAWPAVRPVLAAHAVELHEALALAPQTNETGRANALVVGTFEALRRTGLRKVRLWELGASAGLNLLVDRFRFVNAGWAFGPADSPVVLSDGVQGAVEPVPFEVVSRRGCDVSPVDVTGDEGRLRLRSFVWPFQVERHERLAAALRLAAQEPPTVDAAPAGEWLVRQLEPPHDDDVLTVVWQSITRQYWPPDERERVAQTVAEAAGRIPLAHVCMEYPGTDADRAVLTLDCSDGSGRLASDRLGTVGDHGFPVVLRPRPEPGPGPRSAPAREPRPAPAPRTSR